MKSRSQSDVEGAAAATFNSSTEGNLPPVPTSPDGSPRRYYRHIPSTAFQCPVPENASMSARACGYSSNLHRLHSDPACLDDEDMPDYKYECQFERTRMTLVS
ncbi:Hypp7310 [Branchiostoma lanceolatum]|uniref:Hypp7310 protein n=1 Tax=Branchiostoma lanceolatum TaxID=7740 RepID=A0A8J9YYX1_BRALA|nr:Hypp7310 [Branchiostoma lanceolatum]